MQPITVYVHFPWCLKKCPYCDFVSFAEERGKIDHARYADAVIAELKARVAALPELVGLRERPLRSVFFGGGTPSLWRPDELGRVLSAVLSVTGPKEGGEVEVTVECNPTSLDEEHARALARVGVNRLSVGVQGLDEGRLRFLGRLHDPEGGLEALRAALRSGMPRVSGDLIFGVAGGAPQKPADAASEARAVAATGVSHVSAYNLTIEPGTQFGELARRGRLPVAPEEAMVESFFAIEEALEGVGLEHYEISNYARPGHEARHNLGYWEGLDYLGLGCAAFGTLGAKDGSARRYRNLTAPGRYIEAALAGASPRALEESEEILDPEARLRERIMLGLRLREGFCLEAAAEALGVRAWPEARRRAAGRLEVAGRLEIEGGRLRIPRRSWVFADGTAAALF
jgi:putative oxygen-independent coproporphyrinogen III oxidase